MISEELQKKIDRAIRLLKSIENAADENGKVQPIEVAYSGGKDSDVILQLAKESGINFKAIYKCTTIDPPGTVKHARDMKVEIRKPREGNTFFKLIQKKGLPSRWHRFCCSDLKEYKILDKPRQIHSCAARCPEKLQYSIVRKLQFPAWHYALPAPAAFLCHSASQPGYKAPCARSADQQWIPDKHGYENLFFSFNPTLSLLHALLLPHGLQRSLHNMLCRHTHDLFQIGQPPHFTKSIANANWQNRNRTIFCGNFTYSTVQTT